MNCSFWTRDGNGFVENAQVKYVSDEYGSIDWKSMIPKEFKYPNKDWFYKRGEDAPESIEGLSEEQMIVSLAGLKWIAKVRGYSAVLQEVVESNQEDYAICKCTINWIANAESCACVYTDVASATKDNTSGHFGPKFLESIAANRAFCRAVRNFLNINSVSDQEIDPADQYKTKKETKPKEKKKNKTQESLEKLAQQKGCEEFVQLKNMFVSLGYKNDESDSWEDYYDVPASEGRVLIAKLKKQEK